MGKPLKWTTEQKLPLVLSVLRGEGSVAEIGRRHRVSDVTLAKWRDAFLAGGAGALANGRRRGECRREAGVASEVDGDKAERGGEPGRSRGGWKDRTSTPTVTNRTVI